MTMIKGANIAAARCCGAMVAVPIVRTMNYSSAESWSDGWRHLSLMPNDSGLRLCRCGQFFHQHELVVITKVQKSELPRAAPVPDERWPDCIAWAPTPAMAVLARLAYWQYLAHPYREAYRAHRASVEAANNLARDAGPLQPRPRQPFTVPPFEPTPTQLENMHRLRELLTLEQPPALRSHVVARAELHRQLGQFEEAVKVCETVPALCADPSYADMEGLESQSKFIKRMAQEGETAPMRYRG